MNKATIIQSQRITRLLLKNLVKVTHGLMILLLFIVHQGTIEIGESIGRIQPDCMIHICNRLCILLLSCIQTSSPYKALRIKAIQFDSLVIICKGLERISKEQVACTSVQICRRILRFLLYVPVKIGNSLGELLRKEICDTAAEVQSHITGAQVNRFLHIGQCSLIVTEAARCNTTVMVSVCKNRIDAYGTIKIALRSAKVSKIILRYATEKKVPVIRCIQLSQNIEILNCTRVFSL